MCYLFEPVYHKFSRSKFQVYERWRSPRYLSALASIVPILTQWYPPVKLQRGRAWLICHYLNPNNQKVYRHIPIYVYVPLYDKTNSSSDISGLICIDNWLLHRQSHNFVPLYLHVEVLYILDSSGSLFRRIRKSLKILMMLLLQIILGF